MRVNQGFALHAVVIYNLTEHRQLFGRTLCHSADTQPSGSGFRDGGTRAPCTPTSWTEAPTRSHPLKSTKMIS